MINQMHFSSVHVNYACVNFVCVKGCAVWFSKVAFQSNLESPN